MLVIADGDGVYVPDMYILYYTATIGKKTVVKGLMKWEESNLNLNINVYI